MDIDSIIAEGLSPSADNAQPQVDANTPATEETKLPDDTTKQEDAGNSEDNTPFPKKALNALSRRDKQIGKLRAQYEQVQTELNQLRQVNAPKQTQQTSGAPKEADFTNYAEYLQAVNNYNIDQKFAEYGKKQTDTQQSQQEQRWTAERENFVTSKAQELAKELPELPAIVGEYADVVDEWSPQLQRLFLEADNAPLAFYNLAKEGKIESLSTMSLAKAAMEIGRAQTQAAIKPQSKAPVPLSASRGSVASSKSLDSMDGDELLKWVNAK